MMIAEGVIAMIWAAASMSLFDGQTLSQMISAGTPSAVVNQVSVMLLGNVLGTIAILGVIVLPISSGLSAFRSLRIILSDYLHIKQDTIKKILLVTLPLFIISFVLTNMDFTILWRYFTWANQVTAVIALFVSTRYLFLKEKNYLVTLIPGVFMLYACVVYIISEPIGLRMGLTGLTYILAFLVSLAILGLFWKTGKTQKAALDPNGELINDQLPIGTFSNAN